MLKISKVTNPSVSDSVVPSDDLSVRGFNLRFSPDSERELLRPLSSELDTPMFKGNGQQRFAQLIDATRRDLKRAA